MIVSPRLSDGPAACDHVGDFAMARQAQQHAATAGKHLLRVARDLAAALAQGRDALGIDVPAHDPLPGSEQPLRQGAADKPRPIRPTAGCLTISTASQALYTAPGGPRKSVIFSSDALHEFAATTPAPVWIRR